MQRTLLSIVSLVMLPAMAAGQRIDETAPARAGGFGLPERPSRQPTLASEFVDHRDATGWLGSWGLPLPQSRADEQVAEAQGFVDDAFPIADYFDPVSHTEELDAASIAYNPARGEYFVVWHAFLRETATDIFGRRLSATGAPIGNTMVISGAPSVQAVPDVAYEASTDTYWVTWTDFRSGAVPDVIVRRVSGTGQLLGSEITVNDGVNEAFASRVACGAGRCVVTWQSVEANGVSHVLIQGYEASGAPFATILLLTDGVGRAAEPDICFNPTDQHFTVAWQRWNGSNWDVSMYRLTRDLAAAGSGSNTVSTATGHQQRVQIAYSTGAGGYLVVWQDGRNLQNWDVYGQLVARSGSLPGPALAIYASSFDDKRPAVAAHSSASEFVVAFERDISGAGQYQIYAARVTGGGSIGGAFPVRLWYNIRWAPAIAHRTNSSDYLAAWTDLWSAIQNDIQVQRLQSDGAMVGSLVNVSFGRKGQETPATAYNPIRNEYLVVWADFRPGNDYDLYARRVSPTGALLGQEIPVASAAFLYGVPEIAYDPNVDEYLVVWQEITSPTTGYEIYARRLSGLGGLPGSPVLVSRDTNTVNEGMPVVAFNSVAREYLVAWHAFTSSRWRIWGQRVSESGQLLGSNFVVSGSTRDTQAPRIAYNPARNEHVLVWLDWRNNRADVYGQRLTATGGGTGADLAISTANGDKGRCDIGYNATDANYLVVWGDKRNPSSDIYGQMLDAGAQLSGSSFPISASALSEVAPLVSWDPKSGDFFVAWWEYHDTTDYDIWACTVSGTGNVARGWVAVSDALEVQRAAKLSRGGTHGVVLVVWQDFRDGNYDVFGRLWDSQGGEVPEPPPGPWLSTAALPGFEAKVQIATGSSPIAGGKVEDCIVSTLCVSGAVAGQPEIFLRVVGPKPNGYLWPTLVKFSTSQIEVWIRQVAGGALRYYLLPAVSPGSDVLNLAGLADKLGFLPAGTSSGASGAVLAAQSAAREAPARPDQQKRLAPPEAGPPPPGGGWLETPALPGFRAKVRITTGSSPIAGGKVEDCIVNTLCVSGAVPGQPEIFLRVVGPKPNGYLWPTLVKFSTSQVEVWLEQLSRGAVQYYRLDAAAPGAAILDLAGLADKQGFVP